ncbi:MAG: potassium channel beta subunit family protein [Actinomycetota bacterium]
MTYRHIGRSGVKTSVLSFGSWVTFGPQMDLDRVIACLAAAREAGVNFFDNAEAYARGESEKLMGKAIAELGWDRRDYLISTKFFWGIHEGPNSRNTLNRKYLLDAIDRSLERFEHDFVDIVYCHRPDPSTPIEETVWALSDIISSGRALYWGTSEWSAAEIREAHRVAAEHHLRAPIVEQPQYNLLWRDRVEKEYKPLYEEHGMGTTIWSPLSSGLLTGKYLDGVPEGSRADLPNMSWLKDQLTDEARNQKVRRLVPIAEKIGCTMAQLAIAWCASNPDVSSVITGASSPDQVRENMQALEVIPQLTPEVKERIEGALS